MRGHSLFQTLLFVGVRVYFMHVVHEHGKGLGTQRCSQGVIWLPGNPSRLTKVGGVCDKCECYCTEVRSHYG